MNKFILGFAIFCLALMIFLAFYKKRAFKLGKYDKAGEIGVVYKCANVASALSFLVYALVSGGMWLVIPVFILLFF